MSDPFDRDKPMTIFDRLRIHENTAEDREALLAELEEEHEALKERHEVLQALLRGRLAGDEDVPAPMKAGDRIPPSVAFVLDLVADLVDSVPEAENYVQLAWTNGATGKGYELTVRYADGEMPATRAARLEKELSDLKEQAASEAADYEARLSVDGVKDLLIRMRQSAYRAGHNPIHGALQDEVNINAGADLIERLILERDEARRDLARIYVVCGEDTDGNDPEKPEGWVHLYAHALGAAKELRAEVDENPPKWSSWTTDEEGMLVSILGDGLQSVVLCSDGSWGWAFGEDPYDLAKAIMDSSAFPLAKTGPRGRDAYCKMSSAAGLPIPPSSWTGSDEGGPA